MPNHPLVASIPGNEFNTSHSFPPAFQADVLSLILGKSVAAILADRSRAPHRLPPACSPPGTRRPTWLLQDVLAWLAEHREAPVAAPERAAAKAPVAPRRSGRPTKVEQARAKQLGISIRELRESGEGAQK